MYQYKFSVIIPIYNVENYLEETLLSVINQTIGFKDNIQLIMVNDGSPDHSEEICLKYKELYPENIIYIKQENAGVGAARNSGISHIQGKYVNFLDADDKWSPETFQNVYDFFEVHQDEIDIVAGRIRFFEQMDDLHFLDYKFEEDKVIDILKDYDYIQLSLSSAFVTASAVRNQSFETRIKYAEDCLYINSILLNKCKYGVLRNALYYYRMRDDGTSAMQNKLRSKNWYLETEELGFLRLLELSEEKYGHVLEYIQYVVMYDTKWRIRHEIPEGILSPDEEKTYREHIKTILNRIEDHIIKEQRNCNSWHYKLAYDIKYNCDINDRIEYKKGLITLGDIRLTYLGAHKFVTITSMEMKKGKLCVQGLVNLWLRDEDYQMAFVNQDRKRFYFEFSEYPHSTKRALFSEYGRRRAFYAEIPARKIESMRIMIIHAENRTRCYITPRFEKFSGISGELEYNYGIFGNYLMEIYAEDKYIYMKPADKKSYKECEKRFCKQLWDAGKKEEVFYRYATRLFKKFQRKKIWLISDRINIARDNGEAFFKYINKHCPKGVKPYFTISKKSEDYRRMKKFGKVIPHDSKKYKLYFLLSDMIISAHIDEYVSNAFDENIEYMKNLYHFDIAFLQHGITEKNSSRWLNRFHKNIRFFITAAKPEYESILNEAYFYSEREVKLTGFPRYDYLDKKQTKKEIIILPTWRSVLARPIDTKTGEREYNPSFKKSAYYQFYQKLINDPRLLECMKKNGYTGKFCLHINHIGQTRDFIGNETIQVHQGKLDYQREFVENALMVTDYSSVAFDFSYMKKGLVYAQFDRDTFYEGQVYDKGFFNYETDGFGPVCTTYEDTVREIIASIEKDCKMEEKYAKRVDAFFANTDHNNCERVTAAILEERPSASIF